MAPFEAYTLKKVTALLPADTEYRANRRLYDGDHWLDSDGWIGPRPGVAETNAATVLAEIQRAFISKNVVREVADRHTGGVIGHEPMWRISLRRPLKDEEQPIEQEQALLNEAETALTEWWDVRGAHNVLQDVVASLLMARRGVLRLFVPPGVLVNGRVPRGDLAQSLARIYLHTPDPAQAAVATDAATQQQAGIYSYQDDQSVERAELVHLDDAGRTLIRILGADTERAAEPLDLGGRLTIYEMKRAALITPQVRQQQYLLNMACTMMGRNVVLAGFLERILLNVQLPGAYEGEGSARRFVPDTFRVGAGTTNVLMGATYTDEQGQTRMATPSVVYRDPVSVETFKQTKLDAYRSILEETDQLHALISGDATASGESRKQARADFELSLLDTQAQVNRAGRWLLETLLAMAAAFSGQPGRFKDLRAVFECRVNTGPISGDDQVQVRENVMAGLLSEETGMARIGVDDVAAEKERIASERGARGEMLLPPQAEPQAGFAVGDRARVRAGMEHAPGMGGAGTIEIVDTPAIGIRLDVMPDIVHKWYVAAELEPETGAPVMPMPMNTE